VAPVVLTPAVGLSGTRFSGGRSARPTAEVFVPTDEGLLAFAEETCATLCEAAKLRGAALLATTPDGEGYQLLGAHELGAAELRAMADDPAVLTGVGEALASGNVTEVRHGETVVAPGAVGPHLSVVLVGRRGSEYWRVESCLHSTLGGATRIAGAAIRDRITLLEAERARQGRARTELARTIHDDVVQRLFGASLVLGDDGDLDADLRELCATEVQRAMSDLRGALRASLEQIEAPVTTRHLADDLADLAREPGITVSVNVTRRAEPGQDVIARSVLAEAVRNARKHADAACIEVQLRIDDTGLLELAVVNDGAGVETRTDGSGGIGLQLATTEAAQGGGILEHGPAGSGRWKVRLMLPSEEESTSWPQPLLQCFPKSRRTIAG